MDHPMTTPTTKKQVFIGDKYDMTLIYDPKEGYMEIVATHKESGRKSSVTNLNYILSTVFGDEVMDMEDPWLHVKNKRKFNKFVAAAKRAFHQADPDLEDALDEDMAEGGWNSGEED